MYKADSFPRSMLVAATLAFTFCAVSYAQSHNSGYRHTPGTTAGQAVQHTSEADFRRDVLEAKQPVLVDFYATWCGPCKRLAPIIDTVSNSYSGKVAFYKVDVDRNPRLAQQYGIMSIPSVMIFKKGKLVDSSSGLLTEAELRNKIDTLL